MVTKTSSRSESSLDISSRPSSTSTPETSSSEYMTPAQCSSPFKQQQRTDSPFAIVKTESLSMAITSPLLSNSPAPPKTIIKTEPPSELSTLQNHCKKLKTAVGHDCPSIVSIKTEPEPMEVTPDIFSPLSNSMDTVKTEPLMPVITEISSLSSDFKHNSANKATVKTEPQSTPMSSEMSFPETIVDHNSDSKATLKTEPLFSKLKTEQPNIPSHCPAPIKTIKAEPQLTVISSETLPSDSEQTEMLPDCNSTPDETPELPSPSNSDQDNTTSTNKSPSTDQRDTKQRESSKSPEPSEKSKTRLRSSKAASSNSPSSRKETSRSSPPLDESDTDEPASPANSDNSYRPPRNEESDDSDDPDSPVHSDDSYHPPSKSSKNTAKKSTSNVKSPPLKITKPAPAPPAAPVTVAAKPSDAKPSKLDLSLKFVLGAIHFHSCLCPSQ